MIGNKKYRVLVLIHTDLVPPDEAIQGAELKKLDREAHPWATEYDVIRALHGLKHDVKTLGVYSDLKVIRETVEEFKPHIVFNLLEEFDGETLFDSHVVAYLELLRLPYTGCNPRGLMLARDKSLSKKVLSYHRIATPKFLLYPKSKKPEKIKLPKNITFPLIVKCLTEEASLGLAQASIVHNEEKLIERVKHIHQKFSVDVIVEEFVEGREFYVGVMGNHRLQPLPVWELLFSKADNPEKELYSRQAKWNQKYRLRKGIKTQKAKLTESEEKAVQQLAKKTYKALGLNGYARIDLRMDANGKIFVIEANPNPNIAKDDEFAMSSKHTGQKYKATIQKILQLAKSWASC